MALVIGAAMAYDRYRRHRHQDKLDNTSQRSEAADTLSDNDEFPTFSIMAEGRMNDERRKEDTQARASTCRIMLFNGSGGADESSSRQHGRENTP